MPNEAGQTYRILDPQTVAAWIAGLSVVHARLGGRVVDWKVRHVGDGTLNVRFRGALRAEVGRSRALGGKCSGGPHWGGPDLGGSLRPQRAQSPHFAAARSNRRGYPP